MSIDLSPAANDIPASAMFRGRLCCVAINLQPQADIAFIYDRNDEKLLSNYGSRLSFKDDKIDSQVKGLIKKDNGNVAVLEFGSLGQVVREHTIKIKRSN